MSNLLGTMFSETINSLSNLSSLEEAATLSVQKQEKSTNKKFTSNQRIKRDSIQPLEFPQSEPSTEASSMIQTKQNQTAPNINQNATDQ